MLAMSYRASVLQAHCLWWASLNAQFVARDKQSHHIDADVCIVGAGFTGLWTALALLEAEPDMKVVILEAEAAGYGASGRNGGWASALFPIEDAAIAKTYGHDLAVSLRRQLEAEIDRIIDFAEAEGISANIAKGGTITLARNEAQAKRLREGVQAAQALGIDQDLIWLEAEEASARAAGEGVLGGTFTPHCAAIHPANLVRGLADAVERRGGQIFERSAVTEIQEANGDEPASVFCGRGVVRAKVVVRATEAWTATLAELDREIVPIYSLVIATEPLADSVFKEIGLADRETFADARNLIIYGQRTADNRLVFGGRGAPYHFGSKVSEKFDLDKGVFTALEEALRDLFPQLPKRMRITHKWGGALAVSRDWMPSVGFDAARGMAWSGGYVGDGVVLSSLAARSLADLILGAETERTALPFVGHHHPRWEPEPLRYLGVNATRIAAERMDRAEEKGRRARLSSLVMRLVGRAGHTLTP